MALLNCLSERPEERIRQAWKAQMIHHLGFPKHRVVCEKELKSFPHLRAQAVPKRRIDMVVFAPHIHPNHALYPLLIIECKAGDLTAAKEQVLSYNSFIQAPFVAVANREEFLLGSYDTTLQKTLFLPGLPAYEELFQHQMRCGKVC